MNPLPPNADELVSAYLDGEATPDEVAIVEASPELRAQVDSLRALSARLGTPVAPPAQKEAHLAAALDAFDAMFAGDDTTATIESTATTTSPALAAVPDADHEAPPVETTTVTSLESARERRRPRRFNTGVIAAAAAALLLFVGLAALSFGRNSADDVASEGQLTTAVEASSSDAVEDAAGDAMDDEEAMEEEAESSRAAGGLSEAQGAAPAPEAVAEVETATDSDDTAMDDTAMDDEQDTMSAMDDAVEEDAMEEEAMDEEEAMAADNAVSRFFVGEFDDAASLRLALETFSPDDLMSLAAEPFADGLFPSCQQEIAELEAVDVPTLVGEAFVGRQLVEVHVIVDETPQTTIYLIDPSDCAVTSVTNG